MTWRPRENWYRDVWLVLISLLCLATLHFGQVDVEASRRDVIVRACQEQNARNMKAVHVLDHLIAALPPSRRTRAIQNRAGTVELISAIAPTQDCSRKADRLLR